MNYNMTMNEPATRVGLSDTEIKKFSLLRAISAAVSNDWKDAGLEKEASQLIATKLGRHMDLQRNFFVPYEVLERSGRGADGGLYRDLSAGTTSAGGYLVETQNVGFIDLLRKRSVCLQMGVSRLPGLRGNVTIPKQSAGSTAYWLTNEATTTTESNVTFTQVSLSPKNVAAYVEISRQLLLQSSPGAEGIVTNDLAKQVGSAVDLAILEGTGTEQPTGISGTVGIGTVTGATLSYAGIVEFQTDVAAANVSLVSPGYVTTPAVAGILMQRQRFTSTDTPLWDGAVADARMAGYPARSTNQLTAATMIYGDWADVLLGEWGILSIEVNPFADFKAGIIGVRAMWTVDIAVRNAAAFSRATGIT